MIRATATAELERPFCLVRGGGDLATGVVWRLTRAGWPVVVLELAEPLTVRRTVSLSTAVSDGAVDVEGMIGVLVATAAEALDVVAAKDRDRAAAKDRGEVAARVRDEVFPKSDSVTARARDEIASKSDSVADKARDEVAARARDEVGAKDRDAAGFGEPLNTAQGAKNASSYSGAVPVLVAPTLAELAPFQANVPLQADVVVDARMAKRNIDTTINDAEFVVGLGPGFTAGVDCHAVVETMRGHRLGRVIWAGPAAADTGVAGLVAGRGAERVLRAPTDGIVNWNVSIGDVVATGDRLGDVRPMTNTGKADIGTGNGDTGSGKADSGTGKADTGSGNGDSGSGHEDSGSGKADAKPDSPSESVTVPDAIAEDGIIRAPFAGVVRGAIRGGTRVPAGLKIGDLDPRCDPSACHQISDKALAVGGGVLEAILAWRTGLAGSCVKRSVR